MLKLSDCLFGGNEENNDQLFDPEIAIGLLRSIIERKQYSPVLYQVFYKWRTKTQEYRHGMSNLSGIPNTDYNLVRWEIVQTIKQYLIDNPHVTWAKTQVDLLLRLPNIARGGPFGNDNIIHDWNLYHDLDKVEQEKEL